MVTRASLASTRSHKRCPLVRPAGCGVLHASGRGKISLSADCAIGCASVTEIGPSGCHTIISPLPPKRVRLGKREMVNKQYGRLRLPSSVADFFSSEEVFVMTPPYFHGFLKMARRRGVTAPRAYIETDDGLEKLTGLDRRNCYTYLMITAEQGSWQKVPCYYFKTTSRRSWRFFDDDEMVLLVVS